MMGGVPLPLRGRPGWETLCSAIREADGETNRYSPEEKARIHTAKLLIDREHPTQKMGEVAAREICIALVEWHEATRPLYDPKKVDDEWRTGR